MLDAIVIGGGPAGLAAACWIARYRRSVLMLDSGQQRNLATDQVHGYLGADPCSPQDLIEQGRKELLSYPHASVRDATAGDVVRDGDAFVVDVGGELLRARRLVLATGVLDVLPDIAGFLEHYGASVFHCPSCDGYEARDRHVAVVGWGEHVSGFVRDVFRWARSITVITDGHAMPEDARAELEEEGVTLVEDDAVELLGARGDLKGARMRGGSTLEFDLAFFTVAKEPRNSIARSLGCEIDDDGYVVTDLHGRTTVDGVYAAGDLTPGTQLVQIAAAKGVAAGIDCATSIGR